MYTTAAVKAAALISALPLRTPFAAQMPNPALVSRKVEKAEKSLSLTFFNLFHDFGPEGYLEMGAFLWGALLSIPKLLVCEGLAKTFARYRGSFGPSDPKWPKESEMSSRDLSAPGLRKIETASKRSQES